LKKDPLTNLFNEELGLELNGKVISTFKKYLKPNRRFFQTKIMLEPGLEVLLKSKNWTTLVRTLPFLCVVIYLICLGS
jgi:hypothetical protein